MLPTSCLYLHYSLLLRHKLLCCDTDTVIGILTSDCITHWGWNLLGTPLLRQVSAVTLDDRESSEELGLLELGLSAASSVFISALTGRGTLQAIYYATENKGLREEMSGS